MIKAYCKLYYLPIIWIFRINIGDLIWYKSEQYTINNGNMPDKWDIGIKEEQFFYNPNQYYYKCKWIHKNEIKKIKTIKNLLRSYKFGYQFYKTSWFLIWKLK
jgi:hypothetical protein